MARGFSAIYPSIYEVEEDSTGVSFIPVCYSNSISEPDIYVYVENYDEPFYIDTIPQEVIDDLEKTMYLQNGFLIKKQFIRTSVDGYPAAWGIVQKKFDGDDFTNYSLLVVSSKRIFLFEFVGYSDYEENTKEMFWDFKATIQILD